MDSCSNHCIVTYIDLIGMSDKIEEKSEEAVKTMQAFHMEVNTSMQSLDQMEHHNHAYVWNDSVLLVAFIDEQYTGIIDIVREIGLLKRRIDAINKSYAILVKGMSFKEPCHYSGAREVAAPGDQPRFVFLKASSYAFSNCFKIEDKLGKKHKKDWYVDERIYSRLGLNVLATSELFTFLPNKDRRKVYMTNGYLFSN